MGSRLGYGSNLGSSVAVVKETGLRHLVMHGRVGLGRELGERFGGRAAYCFVDGPDGKGGAVGAVLGGERAEANIIII